MRRGVTTSEVRGIALRILVLLVKASALVAAAFFRRLALVILHPRQCPEGTVVHSRVRLCTTHQHD